MQLPTKETKEAYVREVFNAIAHKYDLMNTLMTFGLDRRWRRFVVRRAEVKAGMHVLDVCCGTGMLCAELSRVTGPSGMVTGLDFSEKMLEIAHHNYLAGRFGSGPIQFMQGNAMHMPFEDNSFDAATVGWGLRNVPDLEGALREMIRVVKPGGKIVSLDMAKPSLPVFKQGYWLYFEKMVPLLGRVWAGKRSAYQYLYESAKQFPSQQALASMFANNGLTDAHYHSLFGGVVALVEGRKPYRI